jgi:hypothetical protein
MHGALCYYLATRLTVQGVAAFGAFRELWYSLALDTVKLRWLRRHKLVIGKTGRGFVARAYFYDL